MLNVEPIEKKLMANLSSVVEPIGKQIKAIMIGWLYIGTPTNN